MSQPTSGVLFTKTAPPANPGYQTATPQTDSATPQQSVTFEVPNTGGATVFTANHTATIADMGKLLVFNSSSAVTLTLPSSVPLNDLPTPTTETRWNISVQNIGAGVLTIDRNGLNIDGAATNLTLAQGQGAQIFTDGTNYFTERGLPGGIVSTAGIVIDGGGSVPATGAKGFIQVPFAGTITGWTLLGDVSGSAQITVSKGTYAAYPAVSSIVASAPPSMSSSQKNTSTSLAGWTTTINAGDILSFNLDSVTSCTRLTLVLQITRS